MAKVGKQISARCREKDCNVSWEGVEGYLKCKGCHREGCKIAAGYEARQAANAKIETEKLLGRMRGRKNNKNQQQENKKNKEIQCEITTQAVVDEYKPAEGETVVELNIPPVMKFKLSR